MQTRNDYEMNLDNKKELKKQVKNDPYRLGYHLMPPTGWLNDPNGLCEFDGIQHIYFQYSPFTPTWGMKLWGHYTTSDWITYDEQEPFLFADSEWDCDGVYSGSAFIEDNQIHYFYTGNVKYEGDGYNYIDDGREQNTVEVISKDGFTYEKKVRILSNLDYPSDCTCHVRDPKIYVRDDVFYMILGARTKEKKGCVLLYKSSDLSQWEYHMRIESELPFGYMWECPDLFDLDGKTFLICCPQGVDQKEYEYANVHQFGCFEINLDLENKTYRLSKFQQLDRGFDIYAAQSYQDGKGRRIFIAWMGIPDAKYHNQQTIDYGWQHALTLPKELKVMDDQLIQVPLREIENLRKSKKYLNTENSHLDDLPKLCEIIIDFTQCNAFEMNIKSSIFIHYQHGLLSLSFSTCGNGRDSRSIHLSCIDRLQIFLDTSSIEIFVNSGKEVFTSRYYALGDDTLMMNGDYQFTGVIYELNAFTIHELA